MHLLSFKNLSQILSLLQYQRHLVGICCNPLKTRLELFYYPISSSFDSSFLSFTNTQLRNSYNPILESSISLILDSIYI